MARFWCECEKVLSNSQNPDIQYRVYSDKEWITIIENEEKYTSPLLIPFSEYEAWLCPNCKRIHIWKIGSMERVALYELVETQRNNIAGLSPSKTSSAKK